MYYHINIILTSKLVKLIVKKKFISLIFNLKIEIDLVYQINLNISITKIYEKNMNIIHYSK